MLSKAGFADIRFHRRAHLQDQKNRQCVLLPAEQIHYQTQCLHPEKTSSDVPTLEMMVDLKQLAGYPAVSRAGLYEKQPREEFEELRKCLAGHDSMEKHYYRDRT